MNATARLYARYAIALLGVTLLAGVHMRAATVWPWLRGSISGPNLVHAHSHAAFFGWAVMGAFTLVAMRLRLDGWRTKAHATLAHVTGAASVAAFVGFALRGYDMVTIPLSAFHVLLWVLFTALVWRDTAVLGAAARPFVRAGLLFLVGAGLATTAPVVMMVRGTTDPWLQQLGVKLFLTPFVTGFLMLTAFGMVCDVCASTRAGVHSRTARLGLALVALGVVPSTALYISAAPPAPWLEWLGRGGMALVATGTVSFIAAVLRPADPSFSRASLPPLAWLFVIMATAKAGLELLAAAGVGASFMHNRAITVAVLHLVLLGVVTPAFVLGMRPRLRAPLLTLTYGLALAVLSVSVGVLGWPWAARHIALRGMPFDTLFITAAIAGIAAGAALLALLLRDVRDHVVEGLPRGRRAATAVAGGKPAAAPASARPADATQPETAGSARG